MSEFFGRNWNLTIRRRDTKEIILELTSKNPLRFTFGITIVPDIFLNFGNIKLYNMPQTVRDLLHYRTFKSGIAEGALVELSAGYGNNIAVNFSGAIHNCYSQQPGADVVTSMELGVNIGDIKTTLKPIPASQLSSPSSIANQVSNALKTIFTDRKTGLAMVVNSDFVANCETALKNSGVLSLSYALAPPQGTIRNILDYLSRKLKIVIFRDAKGSINCISQAKNKTPYADPATETLTIETGNGILGTPVDDGTGVSFRSYLRPDLKIYQKINFRSKFISKTLFTQKISLQGDTRGQDWYSDVYSTYAEILS